MRRMLSLAALILFATYGSPAHGQCVSGTITAELTTDPGFKGYYKYTVTLAWVLDEFSLSFAGLFPGLDACDCTCEDNVIVFSVPAGTSTGPGDDDGICTLDYSGDYVCTQDPTLPPGPPNGPIVKFEPDPNASCQPGLSGTGTFWFYSILPPEDAPSVDADGLVVKHGQQHCFGPLTGTFPECDCTVLPVAPSTFGAVKTLYR